MADKIEGYLEVGANDSGEVVVQNIPQDTGHIVFSVGQARHLAGSLVRQASLAAGEEPKAWFGHEVAYVGVPKYCIPEGAKLVEAYETENEIVICGQPESEPEDLDEEQYAKWYETAHNCDAMGCGTLSHVVYRFLKTPAEAAPIDMLLYCPNCAEQHIDKVKPEQKWDNPPHRSHRCDSCAHIWRPADVFTNGVERIQTCGKADQFPSPSVRFVAQLHQDDAVRLVTLMDTYLSLIRHRCERSIDWGKLGLSLNDLDQVIGEARRLQAGAKASL